ncbi:MAG TPA: DUF2269 domain-containing protein [Stellaceae bacterium]|nr:DUF2269 domain-containing protein [Stellaceae bacterium]
MQGMDWYAIIKTVHIISGAILFGTGLGIAFFFFCAHRHDEVASRLFAARTTVFADFLFTLPAVIVQPVTGFWLIRHAGIDWTEFWLVATYVVYIVAGCCWLPVVWLQIKIKNMLRESHNTGKPLPTKYQSYFRLWFLLGWPAFIGLLIVFFLMVAKPA